MSSYAGMRYYDYIFFTFLTCMITGPITYSLYYIREGLDHLSIDEISTDINSISTSLININDLLQTIKYGFVIN